MFHHQSSFLRLTSNKGVDVLHSMVFLTGPMHSLETTVRQARDSLVGLSVGTYMGNVGLLVDFSMEREHGCKSLLVGSSVGTELVASNDKLVAHL